MRNFEAKKKKNFKTYEQIVRHDLSRVGSGIYRVTTGRLDERTDKRCVNLMMLR